MVKTLEISDETYEKIKNQLLEDEKVEIGSYEDLIGKSFYFRTVTYHFTGKVKNVIGRVLELEKAAWIADSGRFMNAIKEGKLNEVEPVGQMFLNMETVTDFCPWKHALPTEQK